MTHLNRTSASITPLAGISKENSTKKDAQVRKEARPRVASMPATPATLSNPQNSSAINTRLVMTLHQQQLMITQLQKQLTELMGSRQPHAPPRPTMQPVASGAPVQRQIAIPQSLLMHQFSVETVRPAPHQFVQDQNAPLRVDLRKKTSIASEKKHQKESSTPFRQASSTHQPNLNASLLASPLEDDDPLGKFIVNEYLSSLPNLDNKVSQLPTKKTSSVNTYRHKQVPEVDDAIERILFGHDTFDMNSFHNL